VNWPELFVSGCAHHREVKRRAMRVEVLGVALENPAIRKSSNDPGRLCRLAHLTQYRPIVGRSVHMASRYAGFFAELYTAASCST
jgi:hypothetical protein